MRSFLSNFILVNLVVYYIMENIYKYPSITASILKHLRLKRAFSQTYTGKLLGKSRSTVSRIENAVRKLSAPELTEYLKVLDTPYQEFKNLLISLVRFKEIGEAASATQETARNDDSGERTVENDRDKILATLTAYFRDKPVHSVHLFGSIARGTFTPTSDIDLYVEFRKDAKVSLFDLSGYKVELEELTGREVDLVMKGTEHTYITEGIHGDKLNIYRRELLARN